MVSFDRRRLALLLYKVLASVVVITRGWRAGRGGRRRSLDGQGRRRRSLYAAISGVGLDALSEARHPDVAHDVAEAGALDVAAEVPGVLLHAGAPVVLDLVVRAPGEVLRDLGPAVAPARVQVQDQQQLLRSDVAPPHVGPQVVEPPEAAALARALQACSERSRSDEQTHEPQGPALQQIMARQLW